MSLLRGYDVAWPTLTVSMLSYSDIFNVGISIVAPQCFIKGYDFFVFYIATMAQPVRGPHPARHAVPCPLSHCCPAMHGTQALVLMLCGGVYLAASSMYSGC